MVKIIKLKETYDDEGHDLGHPNAEGIKKQTISNPIYYISICSNY
jgi:hypothetical protein